MKIVSLKKISFLGFVLMGVSAITAAIIPSKGKNAKTRFVAGNLMFSANNASGPNAITQQTCKPYGIGAACIDTISGSNEVEFASGDTGYPNNHTISNATYE